MFTQTMTKHFTLERKRKR